MAEQPAGVPGRAVRSDGPVVRPLGEGHPARVQADEPAGREPPLQGARRRVAGEDVLRRRARGAEERVEVMPRDSVRRPGGSPWPFPGGLWTTPARCPSPGHFEEPDGGPRDIVREAYR